MIMKIVIMIIIWVIKTITILFMMIIIDGRLLAIIIAIVAARILKK